MTELERQRRLHVANRLQELNAKHGPADTSLPDWLDHMPEHIEQRIYASKIAPGEAAQATPPVEPPPSPPAQTPVPRPSPRHPAQGRPADW